MVYACRRPDMQEQAPLIDHDNLEEFADAPNYDREDDSDTGVAFYSALARETGGPVLEIACGTGRVSIPIARLGFAVTGVDIVGGMLAMARGKSVGLATRWVEGDARSFGLGERFRLIFITGNAWQAFLTRPDQEAVLERVRAHLHPDGLFAFETRNPRWRGSSEESTPAALPTTTGDDASEETYPGAWADLETRREEYSGHPYIDIHGRRVRVSHTHVYDHVPQILHWTTYRRWHDGREEQTRTTRIAVRFTWPQELRALLHYNGFVILRQYGDWNREPLTAASPSIISVCRAVNTGGIVGRTNGGLDVGA